MISAEHFLWFKFMAKTNLFFSVSVEFVLFYKKQDATG